MCPVASVSSRRVATPVSEPPSASRLSRLYPRVTSSRAKPDFPAPGIPITITTSPAGSSRGRRSARDTRRSRPEHCVSSAPRSSSSSATSSARASDDAVSTRVAPGIGTMRSPKLISHASAMSSLLAPCFAAIRVSSPLRANCRIRSPPGGRYARSRIPLSRQYSATPFRKFSSSSGERLTCTDATPTIARAARI